MITELDGFWKVQVFGEASVLNALEDHKRIHNGLGHNIIPTRAHHWGWFSVENSPPYMVLNYNDARNPLVLRPVRDFLVRNDDGWCGTLKLGIHAVFAFCITPADQMAIDNVNRRPF